MTCRLEELPILPEDLIKYFNEAPDSSWELGLRTCRSPKIHTKLENKRLKLLANDSFCWGRCLHRLNDQDYNPGEWQTPGVEMNCDVVEVKCGNSSNESEAEEFMIHHQIAQKIELTSRQASNDKFDIHVILIDSVSVSHAKRSFPMTLEYLKESYGAVEFASMNRIGVNTYPNVMPFLTGKRIERFQGNLWGTYSPILPYMNYCPQMEGNDNLFNLFQQMGYVTMSLDNYIFPVQSTRCRSYSKQLADHVGDNFFLRLHKGRMANQQLYPKICFDLTQEAYNYLDEFINSYEGQPKFSITLETWSSHNGFSDNKMNEQKLIEFFKKNYEKLQNSFVFLISDHGIRMSNAVNTRSGQKELNNPMTFMTIPEVLRNNPQLQRVLAENSKYLQTILDTRDTIVDIGTSQRKEFYDHEALKPGPPTTGSFLREQSPWRNCFNKGILLNYCICQMKKRTISVKTATAQLIGEAVIKALNFYLKQNRITGDCLKWKLNETISIEKLSEIPYVYKAEVKTANPDGHFITMIRYENHLNYDVNSFDRLDIFGSAGNCVDGLLKHVCHCRKRD